MAAKAIREIEEEIIEEFSLFDDWMDKYQYIIELGQNLPGLDDQDKQEDNIVRGCQSKVWLNTRAAEERIQYHADSDAVITKGLIALLIRVLSDHTPAEILNADLAFVDKIGIREHLSPNRSNGLNAMIKQMKFYALAYQAKQKS